MGILICILFILIKISIFFLGKKDGGKVAEANGNCSGDMASSMKHRWYPCSK
jgi:hypothetical protein